MITSKSRLSMIAYSVAAVASSSNKNRFSQAILPAFRFNLGGVPHGVIRSKGATNQHLFLINLGRLSAIVKRKRREIGRFVRSTKDFAYEFFDRPISSPQVSWINEYADSMGIAFEIWPEKKTANWIFSCEI